MTTERLRVREPATEPDYFFFAGVFFAAPPNGFGGTATPRSAGGAAPRAFALAALVGAEAEATGGGAASGGAGSAAATTAGAGSAAGAGWAGAWAFGSSDDSVGFARESSAVPRTTRLAVPTTTQIATSASATRAPTLMPGGLAVTPFTSEKETCDGADRRLGAPSPE
jgi:hypothetical protein